MLFWVSCSRTSVNCYQICLECDIFMGFCTSLLNDFVNNFVYMRLMGFGGIYWIFWGLWIMIVIEYFGLIVFKLNLHQLICWMTKFTLFLLSKLKFVHFHKNSSLKTITNLISCAKIDRLVLWMSRNVLNCLNFVNLLKSTFWFWFFELEFYFFEFFKFKFNFSILNSNVLILNLIFFVVLYLNYIFFITLNLSLFFF